jgi:isopenicillin N synthase-like dioxygenase
VDACLPVIDVGALTRPATPAARLQAARAIDAAARGHGFFYAEGHGVDAALVQRLERLARAFFALPPAEKLHTPLAAGGRAWRGYFPLGGELTSELPDWKEGLYLGAELDPSHPRVQAGTLLHGPNLWPALPGFRETVLAYLEALTGLGHALMRGFALGLGVEADWFASHGTREPLVLLRLFNYPSRAVPPGTPARWGVGEHTGYGLLTLLWQDEVGGLQVRTRDGHDWVEAPPRPGSFVVNVGDMLDRMTGGRYCSVPHRVRLNASGTDRLSIPFFFDPDFEACIEAVPGGAEGADDSRRRWDGANLQAWQGRYGDYVSAKVGKVFPGLKARISAPEAPGP